MAAQSFLLTRPAAAAARFADELRKSFGGEIDVVISPLMEPVFLPHDLPTGPFDALILTSETGAEAARRISAVPIALPGQAYCVGDRTAQAAVDAGFHPHSANGDARDLVRLIQSTAPAGRFLHLRGVDSRGDISQALQTCGISCAEAIVYQQRPRALSLEAKRLLRGDGPVVLPLFSPRSADLIAGTGPIRAPLWIAALSSAVADRALRLGPAKLAVAAQPDAKALLQTIEYLCAERAHT